jgi:hypothetical protein
MKRFNLKKLNKIEGKEQNNAEVSNSCAALEKLEAEVDIMSEGEFKNFSQTGSRFRN